MQTALLVLNWNNARDTVKCLQALEPLQDTETRVTAIDNSSTDDSVRVIRQSLPHIELLETHQNLGYAGGNNFGIRRALDRGAQYVCIINNDVQVAPGFLAPLMSTLSDPQVGVVTPLVAYTSESDRQAGYTVLAVPASVVRHAVSSTLGTASPIIDEQTGLLIERDPAILAAAIRRLFTNPTLATKYSQNGRENVLQNWTWEKTIERLNKQLAASAKSR